MFIKGFLMDVEKRMKVDNEDISATNNVHPIFIKDPNQWIKLLNSQVEVTTEDGHVHCGCVYTVDPVSECIVLLTQFDTNNPNNISAKLLMGHSVTNIKAIAEGSPEDGTFLNNLFRPNSGANFTEKELESKLLGLKAWLEQNRLPVSVSGKVLTVAEALTIHPPYTVDCCLSTNEIILSRIQTLMKNMPSQI